MKNDRSSKGFTYKVKDTSVFVRNRPRSLEIDCKKFKDEDKADAYLSVTDTFCFAPKGKPFVWVPWNEGRKPTPEQYYAVNRALLWWIHYKKLKKVHIFCDGGTHRSVTMFGIFILTYFNSREAEYIISKRIEADPLPKNNKYWRDTSKDARPIEYAESYLNERPEDRLLLAAMGKDKLGRLDTHCLNIFDTVKKRYFNDNLGTCSKCGY